MRNVGRFGIAVEIVRRGGGLAAWMFRGMRVVAVDTILTDSFTEFNFPKAVGAAMDAGFPIAEGGTVATATQLGALSPL